MYKYLILLFVTLISQLSFSSNEKIPKDLVTKTLRSVEYNNEKFLALDFVNKSKWHTYWKNPGDAGQPFTFKFFHNDKEIELEQLEWPVPKRYIENGGMLAFGYEGEYSFFFKWPKDLSDGEIQVKSQWLVCKHICIPGSADTKASIISGKIEGAISQSTKIKDLPKASEYPVEIDLILAKTKDKEASLTLYYNFSKDNGYELVQDMNMLTPFPVSPITFKKEQIFIGKKGNIYGKLEMDWDGEFLEPPVLLSRDGTLAQDLTFKFLLKETGTSNYRVIQKTFKSFDIAAAQRLEGFYSIVTPLNKEQTTTSTSPQLETKEEKSIFYYLLFAFIGGLILNVMPCVLPVISIKLFGLISQREQSDVSIFKHNIFYTAGVLTTFLVLAGIIVALKGAGESVGWGFQLQSPTFVAVMVVVVFIMSFNLFGLFEFSTPGGSKIGNVKLKSGFWSDFGSGVFATILSTPCSAPFLGTALTFAFTSSPAFIFLMFAFIGLGLASPFILTAFVPELIHFLPKPGNWMNHFKKFLGLTLLLTGLWLIDVFASQVELTTPLMQLTTTLALFFFAFYMARKAKKLSYITHIIALILFSYTVKGIQNIQVSNKSVSSILKDKQQMGLNWESWSESRMNELMSDKEVAFIDFTAKWCFTCKINERLVIHTDGFKKMALNKNIKLLLGDWTKKDPIIGEWLKKQGIFGVPAYFVINSKGQLINLGETITLKEIENALL